MNVEQAVDAGNWVALATYMGFSFFAGFAIGYATRTFLNIVLFLVGGTLILLFGLQYAGVINVDWTIVEKGYNSFIAFVSPHLGGLKNFITANLSSAAMAGLGLVLGYRRKR